MRAMAGHGRQQEGIVRLLGRDAECADIDRLLDDARAGAGAALVVRGEPGIGKSALLDYARRQAASMTLLSAAGVQAVYLEGGQETRTEPLDLKGDAEAFMRAWLT